MDIMKLKQIIKDNGVAGAGGAGFPSYAKLDDKTEVVILNGAECEPLLGVDIQLLRIYAYEIVSTLDLVAKSVGAKEAIISIKSEYKETIEAVKGQLEYYPDVSVRLLDNVYPTGDEVVLIHELLGRVVPPGSFPIDIGVTVFNVETMYNIYKAVNLGQGVKTKYLTIAGEIPKPVTVEVPLGVSVKEVVDFVGGALISNPSYIIGGPMTGEVVSPHKTITKTSSAILVLPEDHLLINKKESNTSNDIKRARSTCCGCEMCTNLCPRNLLGHPIVPHMFMRNASSNITSDVKPYINTLYCSSCGICEMYACPQSLSPRKLITEYKDGLRQEGIKTPKLGTTKVNDARDYRKVPMERLISKLDLIKYNTNADFVDIDLQIDKVKIEMNQHLGNPAIPIVSKGDYVEEGQLIGKAEDSSFSLPVHSSVTGIVLQVNKKFILISNTKKKG